LKKEKGFNYMTSENSAVVWNDKYFALASNSSLPTGGTMMNRFKRGRSGESMEWKHEYLPDSLKIFGMEALSGKSKSLESDKRFSSLIKDGNDIHFWVNSGKAYSGMGNMIPLDIKPLLEGNVSAISLNFGNGKISAKLKQYFGEKMSKLMSKSKTEPLTAAVINRIPSSNVAAVIAFNYSPDVVKEFLKVLGADAMADMILAKMDFSLDDFIRANKGQVLISISDPGMTGAPMAKKSKGGDEEDTPRKKNNMKVLFATAVNDKATFEKMVTLIWDAAKKLKKGGDGDKGSKAPPFSYRVENNWFAASNSAELTDKFLAGGDNKLPFTDKITGHPFAIYVDLQKITGAMHRNFNPGDTSKAAINIWQDIIATGGEYKDDGLQFEAEVNMIDKSTNSLKQINKYFDNLHSFKKEGINIKEITLEDVVKEKDEMEPPPPPKKKADK
ncbi:MAG TPA: DUF4836 family protein, partial [Chitinophagaceae bacterium]|nr:DUF4836 family protein [Chitinophagaceae bacterium]